MLVLVLKDFLRTITKSLSLIVRSWSLSKSPLMGPCFGGPRSTKVHLLWTSKAQSLTRRRHSRESFHRWSLVYCGTHPCQKWTVAKQRLITPAVKLPTVCRSLDSWVSVTVVNSCEVARFFLLTGRQNYLYIVVHHPRSAYFRWHKITSWRVLAYQLYFAAKQQMWLRKKMKWKKSVKYKNQMKYFA